MNKINFKEFLMLLPDSNEYFRFDYRKAQIENEIEEKVNLVIDEEDIDNVKIYNETYICVAKEFILNEKRARMFESLKCFADELGITIKSIYSNYFNDVEFRVCAKENSLIDLEETDSEVIYENLSTIYSNILEKNKKDFPYLLTGRKFDNALLLPLEEYLYCYESKKDRNEINVSLYFEAEPEVINSLSYRDIFNGILKEYFRWFLREIKVGEMNC